jgi:2-haloacid dehalogenase
VNTRTRWRAIFLDADDTLLDYPAAERAALLAALDEQDVRGDADELVTRYRRHNADVWRAYERGYITQQALRTERFHRLAAELGLTHLDIPLLAERYLDFLSEGAHELEGAADLVARLARRHPLAIVTNGIARVQRARFARVPFMQHIRHIVISEEAGVAKPDPRIFAGAFATLGVGPHETLFIGDSTTSDMPAAHAAGMDFCWYNPKGLPVPDGLRVHADVRTLADIAALVSDDGDNA